jgi:hypothetical protein
MAGPVVRQRPAHAGGGMGRLAVRSADPTLHRSRSPSLMLRACVLAAVVTSLSATSLAAQMPTPPPEDVRTLDGIISAFYDVISGPAGAPRQWQRDSSLYIPGVRFVSTGVAQGRPTAQVSDHGQYIALTNDGMVRNGFFEREIHRVTRRFGNLVHVFSTYEYRATASGPVQGRGVNSIQLFWDGTRWWIANATWEGERRDNPIPPEFLPTRP